MLFSYGLLSYKQPRFSTTIRRFLCLVKHPGVYHNSRHNLQREIADLCTKDSHESFLLLIMPVMSNDMLNNRWELRRIVHDMLRRKQHALEQPLPRERRADGNHVHPCRQGCLYAGGRVFED